MNYVHQLTFLRFIAALTVVVFHFAPNNLINVAPLAVTAVSFFFFLSGVVLSFNYFDNKALNFREFFLKRMARIYPVYLLALLLTIAFSIILNDSHPKGLSIILQVVSVQAWVPGYCTGVNFPAWSVSVELFFYAIFPLTAAYFRSKSNAKMTIVILVIWVLSFAQHVWFMTNLSNFEGKNFHQFTLYFPIWHLSTFFFGMLCGRFIKKAMAEQNLSITKARLMYSSGVFLFLLVIFSNNPIKPFISSGFLSPVFFLIIAGIALDKSNLTRLIGHRFFVLLGNASYSIYILQWPIMILFMYIYQQKELDMQQFLVYLLSLIVLSIVVYVFFEKKAKNFLLKKWRNPTNVHLSTSN